jgi:hypothetical protein
MHFYAFLYQQRPIAPQSSGRVLARLAIEDGRFLNPYRHLCGSYDFIPSVRGIIMPAVAYFRTYSYTPRLRGEVAAEGGG